jgi:hypothetical protein
MSIFERIDTLDLIYLISLILLLMIVKDILYHFGRKIWNKIHNKKMKENFVAPIPTDTICNKLKYLTGSGVHDSVFVEDGYSKIKQLFDGLDATKIDALIALASATIITTSPGRGQTLIEIGLNIIRNSTTIYTDKISVLKE